MAKNRYRPNYSGLAYAGGGSLANVGSAMIGGGLAQDEKNMAAAAKNKAFNLEKKKVKTDENYFNLNDTKYKDSKVDAQKKESVQEAEKKSNINSTRKYLDGLKIDTKGMSDEDIFYNGSRLESIYKDQTDRKTPKFFSTTEGVAAAYLDKDGNPVTKLVFKSATPKNKADTAKTDGYIQLPSSMAGKAVSDNFESKRNFNDEGIPGTWVSKDEWAARERAKNIGAMDLK